jgi:endonuclease-3
MKASEKQDLTKKLVTRLEKQFGRPPETPDRSVLDTLIYGVCLENDGYAAARRSFDALHEHFHDLNEIRVSSITEIVVAFPHQSDPDLRAHRVRSILQNVFEDHFEFDLETIRKKTQEQAAKKLSKIAELSPFVRNYVQQVALAAHLIPMDDRMTAAAVWLGLVEPGTSTEAAAEALKPAVRKADAPLFCHLLRCLAAEPPGRAVFAPASFSVPEEGYSAETALARLDDLLAGRSSRAAKPKAKADAKTDKKPAKAAAKAPAKKTKTPAPVAKKPAADKKAKGRSRAAT